MNLSASKFLVLLELLSVVVDVLTGTSAKNPNKVAVVITDGR